MVEILVTVFIVVLLLSTAVTTLVRGARLREVADQKTRAILDGQSVFEAMREIAQNAGINDLYRCGASFRANAYVDLNQVLGGASLLDEQIRIFYPSGVTARPLHCRLQISWTDFRGQTVAETIETKFWELVAVTPDNGSCGTCFLAGTPILMADGSTKDIETIKVGDTVIAFDQESGKNKSDEVVETFIHEEDSYLLINNRIKATSNHPVFHKGRWVDIGLLNIGDELTKVDGSKEKITSIEKIKEPVMVYNLEVNPYHTYYADNILAHNKGCLLPGTSILMADGTNKFIENIVTGDKVTSYSENSRTKLGDTVKEVFMHEVQGYLIINDGIKVTTEHPFFANGAWVRAGKLKQGDILLTQEGKEETITSIEAVDEKIIVYNIEVNPYHNYFANGYLVHNKDLPAQGRDPGGCPPFCAIKKFFSNLVFAEDMGSIDNYTFSVVADNIIRVDFQGFDESGNPKDSNPDSVNIIIEASKDSMMSGPFEFSITSSVTLRN